MARASSWSPTTPRPPNSPAASCTWTRERCWKPELWLDPSEHPMKYFPLIWATLWRKKTRTIFTLLSVVVAFLLFGMLETVDYAFSHPSGGIPAADKLITTNKYSITLSLPFSDAQQIRSVPGVVEVSWISWIGGYFQESKSSVFAIPVDTDSYFNLHKDEYVVSDEQMQAYRNTRTGALVNSALMKKFGWKVGDKVPLH